MVEEAAAHVPSALKKVVVPPPEEGTRPASVEVNKGSVASVPVEEASKRVEAVYVKFVAVTGAAHVPSARRKLLVPPPDNGTKPASVEVNNGRVMSDPVEEANNLDEAV